MRIHELVTEAFMPTSAFTGSDKNKLGPAGHLKGSMKRPAGQGDLVGENFGNYYNENIASKVFSQHPDLTSEDDVLNAAWEHVVRDMGRKKAGHLFNYDEDFPSDLVSSYFYLQKQGVAEDQSVSEKTDADLCRSSKRLGSSDHSSCVSQGLRAHQSKGKGHTDGQGSYIKGKKIRGSKYGGPLPDQDGK
jgi:hypothetical protein